MGKMEEGERKKPECLSPYLSAFGFWVRWQFLIPFPYFLLLLPISESPQSALLGFHHLHSKFPILRLAQFLFAWLDPETINWFLACTMEVSCISTKLTNFVGQALMLICCIHKQDTESGLLKPEELPASDWAVLDPGLSYIPVLCDDLGSPATLPCFPSQFSSANLVQDFSTFKCMKRDLESCTCYPLKNLKSFGKLTSHVSSTQSYMTKTIKLSSLSSRQWMPSVLSYNCIKNATSKKIFPKGTTEHWLLKMNLEISYHHLFEASLASPRQCLITQPSVIPQFPIHASVIVPATLCIAVWMCAYVSCILWRENVILRKYRLGL